MTEMSDVTKQILEQNFVLCNGRAQHQGERLVATNDNVSEATKLLYLKEQQQVGVREAAAMQRMDTDRLSQQILQARAASDQPQVVAK